MAVQLNADNSLTFSYRIPAADRARFLQAFAEGDPAAYLAFRDTESPRLDDTQATRARFADQQIRSFLRRWVRSFFEDRAAQAARAAEGDVAVNDP